jgi:pseudouridine-5'-phosphate glycosidase
VTEEERQNLAIKLTEQLKGLNNPSTVANPVPESISLDEDDILRLENIMLKERNNELEGEKARSNFYARLVSKHNVDIANFNLAVDASSRKILLTPK